MNSVRIYTKTGDRGTTGLADGTRIAKTAARIEAIGAVDEAHAAVAAAREHLRDTPFDPVLLYICHRLYNCSSSLAFGRSWEAGPDIAAADVAFLERCIDGYQEAAGPLEGFVLCAGSQAAAAVHLARTAVRRAERRVAAVADAEPVHPRLAVFLNRLSDALFAMARAVLRDRGDREVLWDPRWPIPDPAVLP